MRTWEFESLTLRHSDSGICRESHQVAGNVLMNDDHRMNRMMVAIVSMVMMVAMMPVVSVIPVAVVILCGDA